MKKYNIPIFVPHRGCPFNCVFCNQRRITGSIDRVDADTVRSIIEEHLKTLPKDGANIEAAFFGGSFTGIPMDEQNELMDAANEYRDRICGIRLSTRPDYIDERIMDNLLAHGVSTVELGVQSMDDEVLRLSNRGHTSRQVTEAVQIVRRYPVKLGLQMMTGLVGDTPEKSVYTAREIIKLKTDMVRIYPTLTIKDTYLEKMYLDGRYKPQTLDEAAELAKELILMFEAANIDVIRVGLQATKEISEEGSVVAGPVHSAFRELAESRIYFDIISEKIKGRDGTVTVEVSPSEISKAVGNGRENIKKIYKKFGVRLKIIGNADLKKREVRCVCC